MSELNTDHTKLVRRLFRLTIEGKLDWQESGKDGFYLVAFPEYSLSIGGSTPHTYANIYIHDEFGSIVDTITLETANDEKEIEYGGERITIGGMLDKIEKLARRKATNADVAVQAILKHLDDIDEENIPF